MITGGFQNNSYYNDTIIGDVINKGASSWNWWHGLGEFGAKSNIGPI